MVFDDIEGTFTAIKSHKNVIGSEQYGIFDIKQFIYNVQYSGNLHLVTNFIIKSRTEIPYSAISHESDTPVWQTFLREGETSQYDDYIYPEDEIYDTIRTITITKEPRSEAFRALLPTIATKIS